MLFETTNNRKKYQLSCY